MPSPASADEAVYLQARAAWPGVELTCEDFLAHVRARSEAGAIPAHAEDLYLACACARGLPAALALFERQLLPGARQALARRGLAPDVVDEALQRVRERLLVARGTHPPRVAEYDGRGALGAWVRTVALRVALTELRERAARPVEPLGSALLPARDASFAALKHRHHEDLEAAISAALASLEPRERAVLRLHLVEGVGVEDIGRVHGVSRATMTRWLKAARDTLAERTHDELRRRLQVDDDDELQSLARTLLSGLELSARHLLR